MMRQWDPNTHKKVLVLDASPVGHDGCTMLVTKSFLKGFSSVCDTETEIVKLGELNVQPCCGCLSCWASGDGDCVIKGDDIAEFKRKILAADVFIESFPLYFFGMPGTLKVFTDRMLGMMRPYRGQTVPDDGSSYHGLAQSRPDRRFIIVSSCAHSDTAKVYAPLLAQFDCICGRDNYTPIFSSQLQTLSKLDYNGAERRLNRHLQKYEEAGREFAQSGALDRETLNSLMRQPFGDETYKALIATFWARFEKKE